MPNLTTHAKRRMRQRSGITAGHHRAMNKKVFKAGIPFKSTQGALRDYINKINHKNNTFIDTRVYGNNIYLFKHNTLITVLNLPEDISCNLSKYTTPETYLKYLLLKDDKRKDEVKNTLIQVIKSFVFSNSEIPYKEMLFKINTRKKRVTILYKSAETLNGPLRSKIQKHFSSKYKLIIKFEKTPELEIEDRIRFRTK